MKVLQVNSIFRKGSTGKIVNDIHSTLNDNGIESMVCYGRGSIINEKGVYKFCSELEAKLFAFLCRFGWMQYAVAPIATKKLISIIKKESPDVVHLQCINGFCVNIYKLLVFLAKNDIKTIVTHHGEFFYTGSCGHAYECEKWTNEPGCGRCPILSEASYSRTIDLTSTAWKKMHEAFNKFKKENLKFTAVSPWVVSRHAMSPICNQYECTWVTNGVDTNVFKSVSTEECEAIMSRLPRPDKGFILHVTAFFSTEKGKLKGGYYIKELAERMPEQQFVVVAGLVTCAEGLPSNVYVWGRAKNQKELAALYTAANLTVITSKRETFSMVTAESLCCGTPVVGFKAGGPESICISQYTSFVEYGDVDSLLFEISNLNSTRFNASEIANKAKETYSKETMTYNFTHIYNNI